MGLIGWLYLRLYRLWLLLGAIRLRCVPVVNASLGLFRHVAAAFHDTRGAFTRAPNRVFSAFSKVFRLLAEEFADLFAALGRQEQCHDHTAKRAKCQSENKASRILGHTMPF